MAQLKKFGIFDAISQYLSQRYDEMLRVAIPRRYYGTCLSTGTRRSRRAYRDGRARERGSNALAKRAI